MNTCFPLQSIAYTNGLRCLCLQVAVNTLTPSIGLCRWAHTLLPKRPYRGGNFRRTGRRGVWRLTMALRRKLRQLVHFGEQLQMHRLLP